jgi:putative phage-type endonuclease
MVKFLESLNVTPAEREEISVAPQRSQAWLRSRRGRLTASNFGAAIGANKYQTKRALLAQCLWPSFKGNAATEYGTKFESVAVEHYKQWLEETQAQSGLCSIDFPGLLVNLAYPWIGCSPDGIVTLNGVRFLLEIKCPFKKAFYDSIPPYYYAQIQGICGFECLPWCDFVTYTPQALRVQRFMFDKPYFEDILLPGLEHFYFAEFLPRLFLRESGALRSGEIDRRLQMGEDNVAQEGDVTAFVGMSMSVVVGKDKKAETNKEPTTHARTTAFVGRSMSVVHKEAEAKVQEGEATTMSVVEGKEKRAGTTTFNNNTAAFVGRSMGVVAEKSGDKKREETSITAFVGRKMTVR